MLDTIRLSQSSKEQLLRVKRHTGIKNWNVLCRWALMLSLGDRRPPSGAVEPLDSNVEMTWRTFGGRYESVILALVRTRAKRDGQEEETCLQLHLQRGIRQLLTEPELGQLCQRAIAGHGSAGALSDVG